MKKLKDSEHEVDEVSNPDKESQTDLPPVD